MCTSDCTITSKAKINLFEIFSLLSQAHSGLLHSRKISKKRWVWSLRQIVHAAIPKLYFFSYFIALCHVTYWLADKFSLDFRLLPIFLIFPECYFFAYVMSGFFNQFYIHFYISDDVNGIEMKKKYDGFLSTLNWKLTREYDCILLFKLKLYTYFLYS